jgi:predicted RNA binding protein YcfA (HicA-like mRNA interferase family)
LLRGRHPPKRTIGRVQLRFPGLKQLGFEFDRQAAGSHEIWFSPETNRYTTIPNHPGDMPEGTLRAILKQAGIEPEVFVQR